MGMWCSTQGHTKGNRLQWVRPLVTPTSVFSLVVVRGHVRYDLSSRAQSCLTSSLTVPRVTDSGLMTMTDLSTVILSESTAFPGGTFCWTSPELLDPPLFVSDCRPTRELDCYALGMVIYEVSLLHQWL